MDETTLSPAPLPKTNLGRYRLLATTAGAKVSPLALGGMSFGDAWSATMGAMGQQESFDMLDAYSDAGGNFIDTANNYQNEQSESYIGEWMKQRGNRDEMFVATKYTTNYRSWELGKNGRTINHTGNSRKTMHVSLRDSLRRLQTDYIDLYYVHLWDYTASIEEVMDALHIMVQQGKILYLGVSNTPAWIVSAANTYARDNGKTPFSVYQGRWNVLRRDLEREVIPMARQFGMALTIWDVMGSGKFQSQAQIEARQAEGEVLRSSLTPELKRTTEQSEAEKHMSAALDKVATEVGDGATVQQIALAYVMHKAHNVFPIMGGRKIKHMEDNIKALSIRMTEEQIKYLESVNTFDIGYPLNVIGDDPRESDAPCWTVALTAHVDYPRHGKPLRDL